jgi:hypothetical protein
MRVPAPGGGKPYAYVPNLVQCCEGGAPVKIIALSISSRVRRAHQDVVSLIGVSAAAPGIAVPLHHIQDALKEEGIERPHLDRRHRSTSGASPARLPESAPSIWTDLIMPSTKTA